MNSVRKQRSHTPHLMNEMRAWWWGFYSRAEKVISSCWNISVCMESILLSAPARVSCSRNCVVYISSCSIGLSTVSTLCTLEIQRWWMIFENLLLLCILGINQIKIVVTPKWAPGMRDHFTPLSGAICSLTGWAVIAGWERWNMKLKYENVTSTSVFKISTHKNR